MTFARMEAATDCLSCSYVDAGVRNSDGLDLLLETVKLLGHLAV